MKIQKKRSFRFDFFGPLVFLGLIFVALSCTTNLSDRPIILPLPPKVILPVSPSTSSEGRLLFADNQMPQSECRNYAVDKRRCAGGLELAYNTLSLALEAALPGDTIAIRQGRYTEPIVPPCSGIPTAPITIKNYMMEPVVIADLDQPAINLQKRFYIIIEGLSIDRTLGWGRLEESAHNIIRRNRFFRAQARGTTGGLKLVRSHYNQILENRFEQGNDSIVLQESDRNLIAANTFKWARHSLLSVRCSNFNIIRGNRFHNERQKSMEIYDCEAISDAPFRLNATKRNLVEQNHFIYTRGPSQPHKYNAIQYAGQMGIVRRNFFYDNRGGAINVQVYAHEALHNYGHRIYNNTFYENKCYGFVGSDYPATDYGDIVLVNNLFFKNEDCHGNPIQIGAYSPWAIQWIYNAVMERSYIPLFVSEEHRNLSLQPNSPLIDKGVFLTRTSSQDSGNLLPVEDVKFFSDGFGIENEVGDIIQLAGSTQRARIIEIIYNTKILRLDRSLAWKLNQGVALAYGGTAPDLGAFETSVD